MSGIGHGTPAQTLWGYQRAACPSLTPGKTKKLTCWQQRRHLPATPLVDPRLAAGGAPPPAPPGGLKTDLAELGAAGPPQSRQKPAPRVRLSVAAAARGVHPLPRLPGSSLQRLQAEGSY